MAAVSATRTISEPSSSSIQFHTILCDKACTTVHHELVCNIHKAANSIRADSDKSFEDCTLRWLARGFDRDSAVPDPEEKYQLPLVHLACIFGRHKALEFLLKNGFRANVRNKFDETPVHVVLRLLYSGFSTSSNVERKMSISEKIIQILIENEVDMLFKKDGNGNSPIQLCAYCLLNITEQKKGKSNNNIFRILETQKRFFGNCFRFIIELMLRLQTEGRLHEVVLFQCLSSPNQRGDTLYQMLSRNEGTKDQLNMLVQNFPAVAPSDSPVPTPHGLTVGPQEQEPLTKEATSTEVPNLGDGCAEIDLQSSVFPPSFLHLSPSSSGMPVVAASDLTVKQEAEQSSPVEQLGSHILDTSSTSSYQYGTYTNNSPLQQLNRVTMQMSTDQRNSSQMSPDHTGLADGIFSLHRQPGLIVIGSPVHSGVGISSTMSADGELCDQQHSGQDITNLASPSGASIISSDSFNSSAENSFLELVTGQDVELNSSTKGQIVNLIKLELKGKQESLSTKISGIEKEAESKKEELDSRMQTLAAKEEELEKLNQEVMELRAKIAVQRKSTKELEESQRKLQQEHNQLKRKLSKCEDIQSKLFGESDEKKTFTRSEEEL